MKTKKLFLALSTVLIASVSDAQTNKNEHPNYPNDEIPSYVEDGTTWSVKNNTPLIFAGIKDPVKGSTAQEMAINWLELHKTDLKLENTSDLVPYFERSGMAGHTVRLRQHFNGIPVYQSEVVVHISPRNEVTYVTNAFDPSVQAIITVPSISELQALELAKANINATGKINYEASDLHVYNKQATTQLIYKVVVEAEAPLGSWEVLVNAQTGVVLQAANRACNHTDHANTMRPLPPPANGVGNVFLPDPLSFALASYGGQYVDGSDATNATLDAATSSVTLLDINFTGSMYELKGPYAEIKDFESPYNGLFTQATSVYNYNRSDNAFEAVNCYYHIDGSMRYINETLNIPLMPFQYATGVRFDPSGLSGADNSHYLGGSGNISFGEGGVDDAEDADVVLHELGHGLHDWLTGGNLSQVNGLSEGSGDYWASSYSRSLNQWTPANPQYYWMFSWDGHNPFWNGRVTNYGALYPGGLVGQIHTDGQIWATSLLRIYDIIGREKVDKAFLEGLAMTGSSTNQQNAAIAVRQAAIDMNYSCADIDVFTQEFTATGYVLPALPQPTGTETSTICAGESIIVNGTVYDASNPTGIEVISGATAACDSTVTINLTVLPTITGTETSTICTGESITVNGTIYDAANPTGTEILTNASVNGCESTVNINLNVLSPLSSTLNTSICSGQSITVNGTIYDENNLTGTEVFTNVGPFGCDSTVTVNLTVVTQLASTLNTSLCPGESIMVNGTVYDENNLTGTEIFTNVGPNGCDSVVTINLTALAPLTGSETSTICANESLTINGTVYDANNTTGTEVFTNVGAFGCDSTVTVNLTVLPAVSGSETSTICNTGSMVINGTTYDANNPSGTEVFTGGAANGCDSTVTVNLTVEPAIDVTVNVNEPTMAVVQVGGTYQWIDCDNGNTPIAGATNQDFTATVNGNYAVQVTIGSCTETSPCVNISKIGIEELLDYGIIIYPNPSNGIFTIELQSIESIEYAISSLDGKIVRSNTLINTQSTTIDLSNESKGVYFLSITHDQISEVVKLIVE